MGWMDGWTNGWSATLNMPYRESSIIILPSQKPTGSFVFCDFVVKSTYVKFIEILMHSVLHSFIHTFIQFFNYRNVKTHFHMRNKHKAVKCTKVSQYISLYNILMIKLQSVNREAR